MFTPRLNIPEKGNKYFNRKQDGGYGTSIQGYPVVTGLTCLANCVGYAAARSNEIGSWGCWKYWNYPPNAEDFWARADKEGLSKGSEPKLGAIIVWEGIGSKAGHVAIVEVVNSDGSIVTSESGYGAKNAFWTTKRTKGNGNWGAGADYKFLGFIYQSSEIGHRVLKEGDEGDDVKEMQALLASKGYLRVGEIDGDFGKITKGSLLCFQFENKLEVDGICGPKTWKELQKDRF